MSHVEFFHELPGYTEFLNGLASFTRVIVFDKRGNGLSDRLTSAASLEERMDDIAAIMDAVGSERAVPFGVFSQNRVASYRHKSRHRESDFSKCVTNRGVPAAPVAAPRMGFDWDRFPVVSVEHHRGRATLKRVGLTGWQNSHKQWTRKGADQEATVPSFCMTRRGILIAASMALMVARVIGTAAPVYASGVVTHCDDDSEFSSKLAGGGTVTFNCGSATIVLGSTQTITGSATIDGGGTIALSGENARRLFIVNPGARLELHNIVIENGQSDGGDGGAIYNQDTVVITNSVFRNNATNSAWTGGAIFSTSHLAVSMSVFSNNTAGSGGALSVLSNVSQTNIYGSTFDQNHTTNTTSLISGIGGALFLADHATATITASTLSNNQARRGGAVYAQSGSLLIIDTSHITGNSTSVGNEQGGGIYDELSTAMLTDVDLSGNMAGEGGGLYTFGGEVTLNKVTLSRNLAAYGAGFHAFLGMHTLTNVTISGNTSDSGGALYNSRSTMTLTNVTIANNSTNTGQPGGIVNSGGGPDPHLNLKNVLIAKGAVGTNCEFVFLPDSSDANLSDDASCNFGPGRDNAALNLGPLADNGGFTNTHLPGPGSIAIGNGTNIGCPSTDQRGVSRPQGLFCEVGAVETGPAPPTFSRTPTASITSTPSRTTTPTHTPRPVATPTPTTTSTPSVTKTSMPTPTATASQKPTGTPSDTPTRTFTESPTATFSASPSVTYTPTHAATATPTPSGTASQTPTLTRTATPSATFIPTGAPSLSPSHTRTQTIAATPTNTASQTAPLPPTETATVSFSPTATATPSITDTPTNVSTATPSLPATPTYTATAAPTATATVTPKPSPTSTFTSVCVGDCGGTHTVAVNDVIVLVNITLGTAQPTSCPSGVPAGATVDVSLIIQAVNNALNGCPGD